MNKTKWRKVRLKERKRKPNFSPFEISVITESVKKYIDVIQSKLTNNIKNKSLVGFNPQLALIDY